MYCTDPTQQTANKRHICTWCSEGIEKGERYTRWTSFDCSAFANKMHPECYEACGEECLEWDDGAYRAFDNERPKADA